MVFRREEAPARIDVALHDVAAEACGGRDGAFEVDGRACAQGAERRALQGLARAVRRERVAPHVERGEADAVDGDGVALVRPFGDDARLEA